MTTAPLILHAFMINHSISCLGMFDVQCRVIPSYMNLVKFTLCQSHVNVATPWCNVSTTVYRKISNMQFDTELCTTKCPKSTFIVISIFILLTRLLCTPMLFVSHWSHVYCIFLYFQLQFILPTACGISGVVGANPSLVVYTCVFYNPIKAPLMYLNSWS